MSKILITGANGFVGCNLAKALSEQHELVLAVRSLDNIDVSKFDTLSNSELVEVGDISSDTDWSVALDGVDVVIHCAAIATSLGSDKLDSDSFNSVNVLATEHLAICAIKANVSQFVFMSSIKASTAIDVYGKSKAAAELKLQTLNNHEMAIAIVRPCMMYGPGVKGSFNSLAKVLRKNWPLPFGLISKNKRSVLSIVNLVSFVKHLLDNKLEGVFSLSDGEPISTREMVSAMRKGLNSKSMLIPVPTVFFSVAGRVLNKQEVISRLIGDLEVPIMETKNKTGWIPTQSSVELIEKFLRSE